MLIQNGRHVCVLCGTEVDVPLDQRPLVLIKAASGKPNMRVISLNGKELHACPSNPNASKEK